METFCIICIFQCSTNVININKKQKTVFHDLVHLQMASTEFVKIIIDLISIFLLLLVIVIIMVVSQSVLYPAFVTWCLIWTRFFLSLWLRSVGQECTLLEKQAGVLLSGTITRSWNETSEELHISAKSFCKPFDLTKKYWTGPE